MRDKRKLEEMRGTEIRPYSQVRFPCSKIQKCKTFGGRNNRVTPASVTFSELVNVWMVG